MNPNEQPGERESRLRRAFDNLPKSRYWRTTAYNHIGSYGLTPEIVAATLESPTDTAFQNRRKGRRRAFFRYYPKDADEVAHLDDARGGAWFRVVLDENGALYTAFRDNYTEKEGGRPFWQTPDTTTNF